MRIEMLLSDPPFSAEELETFLDGTVTGEVEVVVADPGIMRVVNREYRHLDSSTDVLSFDLADRPEDRPEGVIYVDGRLAPPLQEVIERIIHGWLHLCGETHDSEEDQRAMQERVSDMTSRCMERGTTC